MRQTGRQNRDVPKGPETVPRADMQTVARLKAFYCLSFWDTDFKSVETHYKLKGRCFHCSIKWFKSEEKPLPKALFSR